MRIKQIKYSTCCYSCRSCCYYWLYGYRGLSPCSLSLFEYLIIFIFFRFFFCFLFDVHRYHHQHYCYWYYRGGSGAEGDEYPYQWLLVVFCSIIIVISRLVCFCYAIAFVCLCVVLFFFCLLYKLLPWNFHWYSAFFGTNFLAIGTLLGIFLGNLHFFKQLYKVVPGNAKK